MASTTIAISGFYAANNKIYISGEQSSYPNLTGQVIDATSGYLTQMSSPGNFGQDKQNRLWVTSWNSYRSYFLQLESNNNVQQSLMFQNSAYCDPELTAARLDSSSGMMYTLDTNSEDPSILSVYEYGSNY